MARRKGLGKYDAPLSIQYSKGQTAFKRGSLICPFNQDTMQYREWQRGFTNAYEENLGRVREREQINQ